MQYAKSSHCRRGNGIGADVRRTIDDKLACPGNFTHAPARREIAQATGGGYPFIDQNVRCKIICLNVCEDGVAIRQCKRRPIRFHDSGAPAFRRAAAPRDDIALQDQCVAESFQSDHQYHRAGRRWHDQATAPVTAFQCAIARMPFLQQPDERSPIRLLIASTLNNLAKYVAPSQKPAKATAFGPRWKPPLHPDGHMSLCGGRRRRSCFA